MSAAEDASGEMLVDATDEQQDVTMESLPRKRNAFCAERHYAEQIMRENVEFRASAPCKLQSQRVNQVFFTHAQISDKFKSGNSLAKLLSDLRRGQVLPEADGRMQLQVCKLGGRLRSLNNRRLWVLKEYQRESNQKNPPQNRPQIGVSVNVHPLCKGTAKFIRDLCQHSPSGQAAALHPEAEEAHQTVDAIASARVEAGAVSDWALGEFADSRSRVSFRELTFVGAPAEPQEKRRRVSAQAAVQGGAELEKMRSTLSRPGVEAVKFAGQLYLLDSELGKALHAGAWQQEACPIVEDLRVIPLCPWTAKFVLANSSKSNGNTVRVRGAKAPEWPLERIVALLLELANALWQGPHASRIFRILGSSRLLGERCALISAGRSLSPQLAETVWPFLQRLVKLQPQKLEAVLPVCRYLCKSMQSTVDDRLAQLFQLLTSAAAALGDACEDARDASWHYLPLVPSRAELRSLMVVRTKPGGPLSKQQGQGSFFCKTLHFGKNCFFHEVP